MNPRYSRYFTFIRPVLRNPRVKTYSSLTFSLVAILIFSIFALKPTITTILTLQKNITDQQEVLTQLNSKAENLSRGKDNLKKIDPATVVKLNNLIPSKTDVSSLADSLSSIALTNEASVSGLQLQPVDLIGESTKLHKDAALKEITFTFNTSGSYKKLAAILDALRASPRLVSVDSVNFNQTPEGVLVMSVNGKAYFLQN